MIYPIVFLVYLLYLYITSVVINGGGGDWAVMFGGLRGKGCWTILLSLTVVSNFNWRLFCWSIWMLCSRISSWISCLYRNLLSAQLWSRLLSWCCPNSEGGAAKVFQSNRKGIFDDDCSRYLASRLFGKFKGKSVGKTWLIDGVDGSESVSGNDDSVVSQEIYIYWFIYYVRFTLSIWVCFLIWYNWSRLFSACFYRNVKG